MKFPKLKIIKGESQFRRWSIDTALDFPEKRFGLPVYGRFVVLVQHPRKKNLRLIYPGFKGDSYSAKRAIEVLEKFYEETGDVYAQEIEMME